jgi:preprotein translocase SecF subunit
VFTDKITGSADENVEGAIAKEDSLIYLIEKAVNEYSTNNLDGEIELNESIGFNIVNGSTATKTLTNALWAVLAAVAVILVYIIIRFTLSSGLAAIIALVHDVLVMLALTSIFQVQVNVTFIAAVITIVGYSINATIVIFDRIRELKTLESLKDATDTQLANQAVKDTLGRSILTTITTLATILILSIVCEIMGVTTMAEFALPIVFGLLAGFYSSVFLSSSIWVYLRKLGNKITSKK